LLAAKKGLFLLINIVGIMMIYAGYKGIQSCMCIGVWFLSMTLFAMAIFANTVVADIAGIL
jgi:hypothetical protein